MYFCIAFIIGVILFAVFVLRSLMQGVSLLYLCIFSILCVMLFVVFALRSLM